jgi:hypothetical protein
MKPRSALIMVIVSGWLSVAPVWAHAAPTKEQLDAHRAALITKLAGQGFSVVIEAPFVVVGDEGAVRVRNRATGFFRWAVTLLEKDWFAKQPEQIIEVWLFKNEKSYRKGAKTFFGDEPNTPYGYYSPDAHALVMNIGLGAGTLSHELVHPYMEANFPNVPAWFNEGVASLYEQPRERDGRLWGTTNWRLPQLQAQLKAKTLPSLSTLLSTTSEQFYGADFDAYAMARFLCQYLQDHGKLHAFYEAFVAADKDPTGAATLAKVLQQDLESFEPIWRKWVMSLRR